MAKKRVLEHGMQRRGFVTVDDEATRGATIGENVYNEDGTLFVPGETVGGTVEDPDTPNPSIGATIWSFILSIPQNVLNVVQGYPMVKIILPSGESLTIASDYQLIVYDSYDVIGDLTIEGDLVIL